MQISSLPFKVLIFAPFLGPQNTAREPKMVRIENHLDEAMEDLNPSVYVQIPTKLHPAGGLELSFRRLKDFHPAEIIASNSHFKQMVEAGKFLEKARLERLSKEVILKKMADWPELSLSIDASADKPAVAVNSDQTIERILSQVALSDDSGKTGFIESLLSQLNSLLEQALTAIFSDQTFRRLESCWRGLQFLTAGQVGGKNPSYAIVPVSMDTLQATLTDLTNELIQDLPSLILIDLGFDNSPRSIELLNQIAFFSETLMVPSICWATPEFLHIDHWQKLDKLPYLPHYLDDSVYAKWNHLRDLPAGKWLTVTCNRFLSRARYGRQNPAGGLPFEERDEPWLSPVCGLGRLLMQSLAATGWPTRFTDWQNIRLENLALTTNETGPVTPTETSFSEERISQLLKGGLLPLVPFRGKDLVFTPAETTVAGTSLCYQLLLSRLVHWVLWCKDHFEADLSVTELEHRLKTALIRFWEETSAKIPENLGISVSPAVGEKPVMVAIHLRPSPQVLPGGEEISLEFTW